MLDSSMGEMTATSRRKPIWMAGVWGALLASSATAAPRLGPEVPVDSPGETGQGTEGASAVAYDGDNYLVVWTDYRDHSGFKLFGARVDRGGKTLDPRGFPISVRNDPKGHAVAYGGGVYLVVWAEDAGVRAARVDKSGKLLDAIPIPVADAGGSPSVASNGSGFLVAWESGGVVSAVRVGTSGAVLGSPLSVAAGGGPRVASDGSGFFVVWDAEGASGSGPRVHGARIAGDGTLLDAAGRYLAPTTHGQWQPTACFDGAHYVVAWEDTNPDDPNASAMRGAMVRPDGSTEVANMLLSTTAVATDSAIACAAGTSLLVWDGGSTRIDGAGSALEPRGLQVPPRRYVPGSGVGSDGRDFLVTWLNGDRALVTTSVTGAGQVAGRTGRPVLTHVNNESSPVVCHGGSGYVAVWSSDLSFGGGLYSATLDDRGASAGSPAQPIPSQRDGSGPAIAWNGQHYLLAWAAATPADSGIFAIRLDRGGKAVEAAPFLVTQVPTAAARFSFTAPAAASDGREFVLVWADARNSAGPGPSPFPQPAPLDLDVYGARIADDGTVLDAAGIQIAGGAGTQTQPAVAFDGTDFLVVWIDGGTVRGGRIDRAGSRRDGLGFVISATQGNDTPRVAWGEGAHLVTWSRAGKAFGRRIDPAGVPLDAGELSLSPAPLGSLAWGGDNFLLSWTARDLSGFRVMGARLGKAGDLLDGPGFVVQQVPAGRLYDGPPIGADVASDRAGHWLAVYSRYDSAPALQAVRVEARLVSDCAGPACPPSPDAAPAGPEVDAGVTSGTNVDARADLGPGELPDGNAGHERDAGEMDNALAASADAARSAPAAAGSCAVGGLGGVASWSALLPVIAALVALGIVRRRYHRSAGAARARPGVSGPGSQSR